MVLKGVGRSKMRSLGISDGRFASLVLSSFLQIVMRVPCMLGSGLLAFRVMREPFCFQNAHEGSHLLAEGTRSLTSRHWASASSLRGQVFQLTGLVPCLPPVCARSRSCALLPVPRGPPSLLWSCCKTPSHSHLQNEATPMGPRKESEEAGFFPRPPASWALQLCSRQGHLLEEGRSSLGLGLG